LSAVAERRGRRDDFTSERHVYEPFRVGLPPLGSYLRQLWRRREFGLALARSELRAAHLDTLFGRVWLVLNPMLMALVYFMLVEIIRHGSKSPEFLAHIMATLFAFRFVSSSIKDAARSVTSGGRLILNTAFPRAILPISAVIEGFYRFLPMVAVYAVVHVAVGLPVGPQLLWVVPIILLLVLFATGISMFVAAAQVYFRDLRHFLRYFLRIWLYTSPIIWTVDQVPEGLKPFLALNPLYPFLGSLSDTVIDGTSPPMTWILWSAAWALVVLVGGGLFFISREREFAVRL